MINLYINKLFYKTKYTANNCNYFISDKTLTLPEIDHLL